VPHDDQLQHLGDRALIRLLGRRRIQEIMRDRVTDMQRHGVSPRRGAPRSMRPTILVTWICSDRTAGPWIALGQSLTALRFAMVLSLVSPGLPHSGSWASPLLSWEQCQSWRGRHYGQSQFNS
jgi:hypothetical protein